jgi:ParB-like chromosome segregation protein Spo0J
MKLTDIKTNPNNPRLIKDDKFKKLVQSIKDFPAMMSLRPIVVNSDMTILGGNMRYKACQELKMKQIPDEWVKIAEGLTPEEEKRFIIEDNVPFGEWDYDILANEWNVDLLNEWGLYTYFTGVEENSISDDEVNLNEEFDPYGDMKDCQRVVFIFKTSQDAEKYLKEADVKYKKMNMAWQVDMTIQST